MWRRSARSIIVIASSGLLQQCFAFNFYWVPDQTLQNLSSVKINKKIRLVKVRGIYFVDKKSDFFSTIIIKWDNETI